MQYFLYLSIIICGIAIAIRQNIKNNKLQQENEKIEVEIIDSIRELTCELRSSQH